MKREFEITLRPRDASIEENIKAMVAKRLNIDASKITALKILRRSIDARKRDIKINLRVFVVFNEQAPKFEKTEFKYQFVGNKPEVLIAGAGPAGLFAALQLIEDGVKPVILERGKQVSERKIDIATLAKDHIVDPDSNYCFGEGGAGTFSDGKLYTRSKKKGKNKRVLEILQFHGAQEEILIDAHPHIGTNVLPRVISNIRKSILEAGGEIHFNTRITDILISDNKFKGVETNKGDKLYSQALILATGHSARDIYELLHSKKIVLEAKSFAMGVRIEHSQQLIDSMQYHCDVRSQYLPAASYNMVAQVKNRGVYSFCMCPGGYIVPSATSPGEVVVNGMSPSDRNSEFANSGMVVEIRDQDLRSFSKFGVLAGMKFQQKLENLAFENGNQDQTAPAQRMIDFINNKQSEDLPKSSYYCGTISSPMHEWLPGTIRERLQAGFKIFGQKTKGYLTNEAIILGVESRTSSPLRIPRDPDTLEHVQISGLYPSGEGAGYAGGIVSSAVDGQRCAEMAANKIR